MRLIYAEEEDFPGQAELWEANLHRSLKGKKGQAALRELESALLALPQPRLIADEFEDSEGNVCALGALAKFRGVPIPAIREPEDEWEDHIIHDQMVTFATDTLKLPRLVGMDVMYENDEGLCGQAAMLAPEQRYTRMLNWVRRELKPE